MAEFSGVTPETIDLWRKDWENYFLNTNTIDIGCDTSWDMLTIKLPVLLHLAKLGAMINTDDPTAELFRLAMIGLAHENEQKVAHDALMPQSHAVEFRMRFDG